MKSTHSKAVVQQITNNTTTWIGQITGDTKNRIGGQTFICPDEGDLDCIEVFSSHVAKDGPVDLTVHMFNAETKTWGDLIGSSQVQFSRLDSGKWISFPLNGLHLKKGTNYGFRLKSKDGLVGVGEAVGIHNHLPYQGGQEWVSTSENQRGRFYSYLSLAFKVDLRA